MIYLNQLEDFHIYKKPFLFPYKDDKRKGNSVFLITPNIDSSIALINHPILKDNTRYYRGYYIERDVTYYVNHESQTYGRMTDNTVLIHEEAIGAAISYLNEFGKYVTDEQYVIFEGHPDDISAVKKYITVDKIRECADKLGIQEPIRLYIKLGEQINSENKHEFSCLTLEQLGGEEIATDYYDSFIAKMVVESNFNQLPTENKYLLRNYITESSNRFADKDTVFEEKMNSLQFLDKYHFLNEELLTPFNKQEEVVSEGENPISSIKRNITNSIRKGGIRKVDKISSNIENPTSGTNHANSIEDIESQIKSATPTIESVVDGVFDNRCFNEEVIIEHDMIKAGNFVTYFNEAKAPDDSKLYKMLYKERIRTNKELFVYYDIIKDRCQTIEKTAVNYERYQGKNIYIDLFYYNNLFFKNNMYKLDRGINLYQAFLYRAMNNKKFLKSGYSNGSRTIIIPVKDWVDNIKTRNWIYTKDINPISMITRLLEKDVDMIKELFGDSEVVFLSEDRYFKVNFSNSVKSTYNEFIITLKKLYYMTNNEVDDDNTSSKEAIVDKLLDDIEDSQNIKIAYLTGKGTKNKEEAPADITADDEQAEKELEDEKRAIVDKIEAAASNSADEEETMEKLDQDEEFKRLLLQIADEEQNGVIINNSRAARMNKLNDDFLEKEIKGRSVKDILAAREKAAEQDIEEIALPIESINEEWKHLTYANMNNSYDPDSDILAMLRNLSNMSYPISIRNVDIVDTSTSEDYIFTYVVEMENHQGKRFKLKFDIPKLINHQYMKLRGNKKVISSQAFLMPILKTEVDTVQIISNYNKIFIYRYGQEGKSNVVTDRIIKALDKQEYSDVKVTTGNNSLVCIKYELPVDYIDLSCKYTRIEVGNKTMIFNYSLLLKEVEELGIKVDTTKGFLYGYEKLGDKYEALYYNSKYGLPYFSKQVLDILVSSPDFCNVYNATKPSTKYMYSQASILSSKIPVIVLLGYNLGLIKALDLSKVEYEFIEKKTKEDRQLELDNVYGYIAFSDGFLKFKEDYNSSMLLNGLRECDTKAYSITELNKKSIMLEFLDKFCERVKADGLDNFSDCMVDPITKETCAHYKVPDTYAELLIHANNLLSDNKFTRHESQVGRRIRRNELIAAYFYKALSSAYGMYATSLRHGRDTILTMKQTAVIDLMMQDPTQQDLSIINALKEKESYDAVTTRGLSGMNSDRSYSVEKRAYDASMINVVGMSTGFAGTVGITRQATMDASVKTVRGYIVPSTIDKMTSVTSLCATEACTPMGTTRDDPFRTAMTFVQTSSHGMRVRIGDPLLVTNGADKALPYLVSDIFAHKAKDEGEVVVFEPDSHMIIKYKDGSADFVDLTAKIEKNSASGFHVIVKLDTDLKLGDKVKKMDLVAYDRESFKPTAGLDNDPAYLLGTQVYGALITTDEGFEDSAAISDVVSEAMAITVSEKVDISLEKNTNIYNVKNIGDTVKANDVLLQMQRPYEEDDANVLLKILAADEEEISELGRRPLESEISGVIQDIEVMRTCELDELSESLRALCKKYESKDNKRRADMKKYGIEEEYMLRPNKALPAIGRLKGVDGVKIIFHIAVTDKMGIGDKLVYWSANKGVTKTIIPAGDEPYLYGRPEVKLGALVSIDAINGRMVTSIQNNGVIARIMVEAAWKAKEMAGIPVDYCLPSYKEL